MHTKGPWTLSGVRSRSPEYKGHAIVNSEGDCIVVVPYNDRQHHECIANAKVLAAAPEMLVALKNTLAFLKTTDYNTREIEDVITKAELMKG